MPFVSLKRVLTQTVQRAGIEHTVTAARIVAVAESALGRLWEPAQAAHVRVVSCVGNTLKIAVTSPAAAHALRLMETAWMNEINRTLGERHITHMTIIREGF
jgi:hypothetical protein